MKLKEAAKIAEGELIGDGEVEITDVSGIQDAKKGDLTFISGERWLREINKTGASAVILKEPLDNLNKPQIIVKNPEYAFARLLSHFYIKPHPQKGISERAYISDNARIGENVSIYPNAFISEGVQIGSRTVIYPGGFVGEKSIIGEDCILYPNVTIKEGVQIGNRVIIHAGAVIGADGFGYVFENSVHNKIPQIGGVIIGDDVEIGANAAIDRATTGNTVISKGTKIDNLVQVGHNVRIGENVILVGQVGIGGSSIIGDNVILAGQVGVADHAEIESGAKVGAQSGVIGRLSKGVYIGSPAKPYKLALQSVELLYRLPEINRKIEDMQNRLESLLKGNE
ncbi:MAG: UDP-3-O-(3-hydroxymyristoyl)glucosamine N-acyltransferase [Nitrospirae bacterium]|nr:UDP-3-O-(3-hydroxymyristoyl)glucosamine N-acyltransferase [Nitrospirota bacterium]